MCKLSIERKCSNRTTAASIFYFLVGESRVTNNRRGGDNVRSCLSYKMSIRQVRRSISTGCYSTFHALGNGQVFQQLDLCMSKVNPE